MYMLTCINVNFIFDSVSLGLSELRKYSPNSRCRPPSCLIAVFAVFFLSFRPGPAAVLTLETSEMSAIFFHNQNNSTSSPGLLG